MPRRQTTLSDLEFGRWHMVMAEPHPSLAPHVRRYVGFVERRTAPLYRRELPGAEIPIVIGFGAPIRLFDAGGSTRSTAFGSFASGVYDSYVVVESNGAQSGIQIDFTILGMRLFLGQPLGQLKNRAAALEDLFGRDARELIARLHDAPSWDRRFDLLDRALGARLAAARPVPADVAHAWRRIADSRGAVPIDTVVREAGCSHRHLIARFKEQIGPPPKVLARVLRFNRAVELLKKPGGVRLADLALSCGYYDQSHFDRDFRAFAGVSPTDLVKSRMTDGGYSADR